MENKFPKVKDLSMRFIGIDKPILVNIICKARKITLLKFIISVLSNGNNGELMNQMYCTQGNPIQYLEEPI